MDEAMREKNEPDVIARRREVYNVLKEQLGPDHIGTVKAGFELAKALIVQRGDHRLASTGGGHYQIISVFQ